ALSPSRPQFSRARFREFDDTFTRARSAFAADVNNSSDGGTLPGEHGHSASGRNSGQIIQQGDSDA
ncbi:MAG: hypothetical protein KDI60_09100, partial [Xanthomonadales bacterium]|nr:hypothetical protein [Xanthomonadales bacterium]